jgi:serine/threonine-protein kinase RsbW
VNADGPIVALRLESKPQTLTIVRGMLSGVAELLEMDPELLDDVKTAVSEACNNVVLHAYGESTGPMEVRVFAGATTIQVSVADEGSGFSGASAVDGGQGIGVSVIRALCSEAAFEARPGGGTEVVMRFDAEREGELLYRAPSSVVAPDAPLPMLGDGDLALSLSPVALLPGVLGRLARTLAAAAHFSLDRFSDVYLVTDTLAAHAERAAANERIVAWMSARERRLALLLGPFRPGSGAALTATHPDRMSSPLPLLADEVAVRDGDGGEQVEVVVVDRR